VLVVAVASWIWVGLIFAAVALLVAMIAHSA
jgi:hypothetical protein